VLKYKNKVNNKGTSIKILNSLESELPYEGLYISNLQNLLLGNCLIPESFLEVKQDVLEEWQKKQLDEEYQSLVIFWQYKNIYF